MKTAYSEMKSLAGLKFFPTGAWNIFDIQYDEAKGPRNPDPLEQTRSGFPPLENIGEDPSELVAQLTGQADEWEDPNEELDEELDEALGLAQVETSSTYCNGIAGWRGFTDAEFVRADPNRRARRKTFLAAVVQCRMERAHGGSQQVANPGIPLPGMTCSGQPLFFNRKTGKHSYQPQGSKRFVLTKYADVCVGQKRARKYEGIVPVYVRLADRSEGVFFQDGTFVPLASARFEHWIAGQANAKELRQSRSFQEFRARMIRAA